MHRIKVASEILLDDKGKRFANLRCRPTWHLAGYRENVTGRHCDDNVVGVLLPIRSGVQQVCNPTMICHTTRSLGSIIFNDYPFNRQIKTLFRFSGTGQQSKEKFWHDSGRKFS
jgi:hypothetical protein